MGDTSIYCIRLDFYIVFLLLDSFYTLISLFFLKDSSIVLKSNSPREY